jgi:hypothetical protein
MNRMIPVATLELLAKKNRFKFKFFKPVLSKKWKIIIYKDS